MMVSGVRRAGWRGLFVGVVVSVVCGCFGGVAFASSLPDGRVYEAVTPTDAHSNKVLEDTLGLAEANGEAVTFIAEGPMGEAASGQIGPDVARRGDGGWTTESAIPAALSDGLGTGNFPDSLVPSADFGGFLFTTVAGSGYYSTAEHVSKIVSGIYGHSGASVYLTDNPFEPAQWLGEPTIATPKPGEGENVQDDYWIAGATPDLSRVYFMYPGVLLPEDESRAPYDGNGNPESRSTLPWGYYEWSNEGGLAEAGVLPDGKVSPFGAVPVGFVETEQSARFSRDSEALESFETDNQVSANGLRAFFVSPDPLASEVSDPTRCESTPPCAGAGEPPEVYVRETTASGGKRSVLVSQSQLPGHVGEPAAHGVVGVSSPTVDQEGGSPGVPTGEGYAYASRDGSHVFFASVDRLTEAAPENTNVKEYDFDVESGGLTYLPGVSGPIVAASEDGSRVLFVNKSLTEPELELWSGPGAGGVVPVTELPTPGGPDYKGKLNIEGVATGDGSVFVFDTNAPVPGGYDNAGGYSEVYRYEVAGGSLMCVSCASGIAPAGEARISNNNNKANKIEGLSIGSNFSPLSTVNARTISADGGRVFFDTPTALVPQASNGVRNVYEWERAGEGGCPVSGTPGCVFLLSSGSSSQPSFYMDNSESGDDVFFTTTALLTSNDVSEAYVVYDARVPRPGDTPAPAPAQCESATGCRGGVAAPGALSAPASSTFAGLGNLPPTAPVGEAKPAVKSKAKVKVKKKKKKRGKKARVQGRRGARKSSHGVGKGRGE